MSVTSVDNNLKLLGILSAFLEALEKPENYNAQYDQLFFQDVTPTQDGRYAIAYENPLPKLERGEKEEEGLKLGEVEYRVYPYSKIISWGKEDDKFQKSPKSLMGMASGYAAHFKNLKV